MDRSSKLVIAVLCIAGGACDGEGTAAVDSRPSSTPETAAKPRDASTPIAEPAAKRDPATPSPEPVPREQDSLELSALNLRAHASGTVSVGPAAVEGALLVRGLDLFVTVMPAAQSRPRTMEDAITRVRRFSRRVESETLDDGWLLSFETKNELGPMIFTQARREIGGESYWCESVVSWPEQQTNAAAFCRSLAR